MIGSKRRLVIMVLVVAMLCTMVLFQSGCGTNKNAATSDTTTTGSKVEATTATAATVPAEPVELSILGPEVGGAQVGIQDDEVAKEIEKLTGVKMNLTPADAVADVNVKLAAMIASNDLPDITFFGNNDLMQSAVTAKILLPMDNLIEKFGQDLKKNVPLMLNYSKTNQSVGKDGKSDGNTYILGGLPVGPYGSVGVDTNSIPWVRWDLYKKLGYPSVDSIDDYIPLIKKLVALEPKAPNGKKTYGIGSFLGDGQWNGDYVVWASIPFIYGYGINTYACVNDAITNDFVNFLGDPDSKFYVAAKFWNRAYREGLLDPESFTMKKDDYRTRVAQGRYLFSFAGQNTAQYNVTAKENGEKEKYFVQLPPPKDTKAVSKIVIQPVGTPTNGWGISKNTKNPELAMKFLNFLASVDGSLLIMNGVKGGSWDIVDGKPQLLPGMYEKQYDEANAKKGYGKYVNFMFMTPTSKLKEYGDINIDLYIQYFSEHPDLNPAQLDLCEHYGVKTPLELITRQANIESSAPENALIPALPQDIQDKSNNVDKYAFDNFIKMIIAKTEGDYEAAKAKFMDGAKNAGNEEVVKWYQDERVKAVEQFNKIKAGN